MSLSPDSRWNHNIHYQRLVLDVVRPGYSRALDVGCGEGLLAHQLRRVVPEVIGIDADRPSIELAIRQDPGGVVDFRLGDFLRYEFEPESFDLVASVAALHHMAPATAISRMRALLRPGGTLVIIGLVRARLPADLPYELAAVLAHRYHLLTKTVWQHSAPTVWPPPHTYRDMRRLASGLAGARLRRHLLWRYSLTWTKPPDT